MILRILFFTAIALLIIITTQSISLFAKVSIHTALAAISGHPLRGETELKAAPLATSADNVYVVWSTNTTLNNNEEIIFRASNNGGQTFGDKINLSNSTKTDSVDAQIAAEGGNVVVSWWERNQTANEPVARISTDNGKTLGPLLKLSANGTISSNSGGG